MTTANPDLADLLLEMRRSTIAQIAGNLPAKVVSYDSSTQTVTVEVLSFKRVQNPDTGEIATEDYPKINNVPVMWMNGGNMSFTTPLSQGDTGFISASERSIDGWKATGNASEETFARRFDITDSVFYPMGKPPAQPLPASAVSASASVLSFDTLLLGDNTASQKVVRGDRMRSIDNLYVAPLDSWAQAQIAFITALSTAPTLLVINGAAATFLAFVTTYALATGTYKSNINATDYLADDVKVK